MKITIAKSTIANSNALSKEFTEVACKAFDLDVPPHVELATTAVLATTAEFENFGITADEQNYVFEMNDECLLKFVRLFVRAAKVLTPVIIMARTLITSLVKDFDEINEFIGKRKFPATIKSTSNVFCGANGWYFRDETDRPAQGTFFTREAAIAASDKYFERLEAHMSGESDTDPAETMTECLAKNKFELPL